MTADACAELGIEPPAGSEAIPSVIIALCEGLMLQWIVDPQSTPGAHQVLDALTLLAPFLTGQARGCVSYMRTATSRPEAAVSPAMAQMAVVRLKASARAPARSAPTAKPPSRHRR